MSTGVELAVIALLSVGAAGVIKGTLWCGKKMTESYQEAARDFEREFAPVVLSSAEIAERQNITVRLIEELSDSAASGAEGSAINGEEELAQMFHKVQASLSSRAQLQQARTEYDYNHALRMLRMEIERSEDIVFPEDLIKARQALNGTLETIQTARKNLQKAREDVRRSTTNDNQSLFKWDTQETQQMATRMLQEVGIVRKLLQQFDETRSARHEAEIKKIEAEIHLTQDRLNVDSYRHDPPTALKNVQGTEERLQRLKRSVAQTLDETRDTQQQALAVVKGSLKALETMLQQAIDEHVIELEPADDTFLQNVILSYQQQITEAEAQPDKNKIAALSEEIEQLAPQVFRVVGEGHEYITANKIAEAMHEQGFSSNLATNAPPIIEKMGGSTRILGGKEGRIAIYYIDRYGHIANDFSGFRGSECLVEARAIATTLRKKGVMIFDTEGEKVIDQHPLSDLSAEFLQNDRFIPHFTVNKRQTLINERILEILDQMGFTNIQEQSSGGTIVIDAYSGNIGYYHIDISSEGKETIRGNPPGSENQLKDKIAFSLENTPLLAALPSPESLTETSPLPEAIESKPVVQEETVYEERQADSILEDHTD